MKTIIKDLKGIATWYTVKPPLMAIIFHSRTGVLPFFFVSCFKQVFYIAKHVLFPKNGVTQVGPSPHTGHLVKDNCSYVQNLTAGFLFCNYLFSSNVWFSNNHFHLFITEKIIYSKKKDLPGLWVPIQCEAEFFSSVLFPNCLLLWHSLLHNTTLFSPYQWL